MHQDQKKSIIKRFLQEASITESFVMSDEMVELQPFYTELGQCLDALEKSDNTLLDFAHVEVNLDKWKLLTSVLQAGLTLKEGNPPQITQINRKAMKDEANTLYLNKLPQSDYFNRVIQNDHVNQVFTIEPLVNKAVEKLSGLLLDRTKNLDFGKNNIEEIEVLIRQLKEEIKQAEQVSDDSRRDRVKEQLTVAEDLLKIKQLTTLLIPHEYDADDTAYCTLAESAGGVTEKVSLIRLATVEKQLGRLRDTEVNNINDYIQYRNAYKLSTDAILKLPKHGKIEEVQRESIALNISRILNLDTTRSSMVSYEGKPALFIPFDDIKLMNEFAKGKTLKAFSLNPFSSAKTYEHYSTINPVGSGLQGDLFTDDFGSALSLLYICSDTDSVGGYNQNKALRNGRSLFIFDQVVMMSDKLKLDSRLSLIPDQFVMAHTRHGQGRNRTIIEDSSLITKFDSLVLLISQQQKIYKYLDRTVEFHNQEINQINIKLAQSSDKLEIKQLNEQKNNFIKLRSDALNLHEAVQHRIDQIAKTLPGWSKDLNVRDMRQALILEKLLHNPCLFTDNGRPYKNPWTYRQNNPVKTIASLSDDKLLITFTSKVPADMVAFLKRAGNIDSLKNNSSNKLEISKIDFARLQENMLHPEAAAFLDHQRSYLDKRDLLQIGKAYDKGHRTRILNLVESYQKEINKGDREQKLNLMNDARIYLENYIQTAKDKGFGMHVLKKMHFDFQQRLQSMMADKKPDNLDQAFAAALKFDRVAMFNRVIASAIRNERLETAEFRDFLNNCADLMTFDLNHQQAISISAQLNQIGEDVLKAFEQPPEISKNMALDNALSDNELNAINLVDLREDELEVQHNGLIGIQPSPIKEMDPHQMDQQYVEHDPSSEITLKN